MRILWLKTELLHPVDKGGKIRTFQMLKEMKRRNHITYLTLDDGMAANDAMERAEDYCHELITVPHKTRAKFSVGFYAELVKNFASSLPYAIKKYESAQMRRKITERAGRRSFDVVVCDFLAPSINVPDHLPCASLLFQHNVEAMIWKRHYEVQEHPLRKAYLRSQWLKTRAFERAASHRFDYVVTVSKQDCETMRRDYAVERIADVPTGVDTEYFRQRQTERREPHNLVFTGSMDWLPNEDAIRYFIEQILPRVRERVPQVTLTVVGRNPYPSLIELSRRDPSVIVTGRVADVRPYMERAAAYVVPLRIGGGTRLKIFEAMAMEQAVISTTVGVEGLPIRHGVELLIADTPEEFANAVVRTLTDQNFARSLGERAAATVRKRFGWDKAAQDFMAVCERAVELWRTKSG